MNTEPVTNNTAARPGKTAGIAAGLLFAAGAAAYIWRFPMAGTPETYGTLRILFLAAVFAAAMTAHVLAPGTHPQRTLHLAVAVVTVLLLDGVLYLLLAADGSGITGTRNILLLLAAYLPSLLYAVVTAMGAKSRPAAAQSTQKAVDSMTLITGVAVVAATIVAELALFYLPGDGLLSVVGGKVLMLFPICYCVGKAVSAAAKAILK